MLTQRLMRVWYKTDLPPGGGDYKGTVSDPIPAEVEGVNRGNRIVAVDWSTPGQVEVTWLINADYPTAELKPEPPPHVSAGDRPPLI